MAGHDVSTRDPRQGDLLEVDDERFEVVERCPCGQEAKHIRWFLRGEQAVGPAAIEQEALLAKEWDEDEELWWWFGRRIALSDLRAGKERLLQRLRREPAEPPKRILYEGRLYRLALVNDPSAEADEGPVPTAVWEFVDSEEIESVLIERSPEGETVAYHGAYYDPEAIKTL